jgi:hypothetical protein
MGQLGRWLAHTLSSGRAREPASGFPQGKTPIPSAATPKTSLPSTAAMPRRCPRLANQPGRAAVSLPSGRLDPVSTPRDRAPAGLPPTALGFSPFLCSTAERGEGGERGDRRRARRHRAAPGRPEAVREPELEPPRWKLPCRGGSCACPRNRNRGSTAAGNTYITDVNNYTEPATTTPPTQREHRATVFSFPPLGRFPVLNRWRRDAPPGPLPACVLDIES